MDYYDGMKVITSGKYDRVYMPSHPNAQDNGTIGVHILVAEKLLGRYLTNGEVVHHIDFNKRNNDPNNIMVFDSQKSHATYHAGLFYKIDYQLICVDHVYTCTSIKKQRICKQPRIRRKFRSKDVPICPKCGGNKCASGSLCWNCYIIQKGLKSKRPQKDELVEFFRNDCNYVSAGKHYGVTDNSVRKWCKYYGLPTHNRDWAEYFQLHT